MRSLIVAGVAGVLTLGLVGTASAESSTTLRYFEKQNQFTYTPAGGKPTHTPPNGPVKPGDRIELAGDLYAGDHKHHSRKPIGSDHTICVFDAQAKPHCDAQAAIGGSMLFISSQGGEGDFTSKITGGTGRFFGARGTVLTHPVNDNSDITVRLR
ncbi:hypothetical protein [Microbispora siamensis]|uniref:Dirigent-like protein n=1 Tax=Microbispora siamensis TaxID=564413 RepID=A0ABQ4H0G6_9ACTN|nr:hypothetical protein [Microbispora siamensis]GIH67159.1 hypothetical protein Msi02_79760 [Microbispora siamensis]